MKKYALIVILGASLFASCKPRKFNESAGKSVAIDSSGSLVLFYVNEKNEVVRGICTAGVPPDVATCQAGALPSVKLEKFESEFTRIANSQSGEGELASQAASLQATVDRYNQNIADGQKQVATLPAGDARVTFINNQIKDYQSQLANTQRQLDIVRQRLGSSTIVVDIKTALDMLKDTFPYDWSAKTNSASVTKYAGLFDQVFAANATYAEGSESATTIKHLLDECGGTFKVRFNQTIGFPGGGGDIFESILVKGGQLSERKFVPCIEGEKYPDGRKCAQGYSDTRGYFVTSKLFPIENGEKGCRLTRVSSQISSGTELNSPNSLHYMGTWSNQFYLASAGRAYSVFMECNTLVKNAEMVPMFVGKTRMASGESSFANFDKYLTIGDLQNIFGGIATVSASYNREAKPGCGPAQ